MSKLWFLIFSLLSTPVMAQSICTVDPANVVLDKVRDANDEVPILRMTLAGGFQALMVANRKGEFVLFIVGPQGQACILAIGDTMHGVPPDERFAIEKSP